MTFISSVSKNPKDEIVKRFLELYETADELKKLFNSFLSEDSLLKTLMNIDSIEDKKQIAEIVVDYLGINFLHTAGKNYNVTNIYKKYEDGKYLIREKLLEKICNRHHDPEQKKKEILDEFNTIRRTSYLKFNEMVHDSFFLSRKCQQNLIKNLGFPEITTEPPPKQNREDETTTVSKKPLLKPLYDYQTQSVALISDMLSEKEKDKRKLINIPTGAGKTRLTVEAIIDWINNLSQNKIPKVGDQQKNGRIIFWFASTNELCSQAASEFVNIYAQIGMGGIPYNVTRLYGDSRRDLFTILSEYPGIHIVVTNTEHFQNFLRDEKENTKYRVDQYDNSEIFKKIRSQTIAIVIDEAHEVTGETYQSFLAAMGFDFTNRKESKSKRNRNNIVLIGLTATPYKGSGYQIDMFEPQIDDELSEFTKFDDEQDPPYLKKLDLKTKLIHKIFGGVYIPIPEKQHLDSNPLPIIEAPSYSYVGDYVKISGLKSFDNYSDLEYFWEISVIGSKTITNNEGVFYHKFQNDGTHNIKLTITNQNNISQTILHTIQIYSSNVSKENRKGNLQDNKDFNLILQERTILCKIIYGVIDGPQLDWDRNEIEKWKRGNLSEENEEIIEKAIDYNKHICEIVEKCIKKYGKKRILIFANGVTHAQNLALILHVKYGLKAKSVDSNMNPGLRRKVIDDFRNGKLDVLCNHGILTTGFDVPKIDTLLICRTVGSNALYTQMIGRGQRGILVGGTENLWLITAHFKKGEFEKDANLRLGWEALVETWEKFPPEIKNDLKVRDNQFEYSESKPKEEQKPKKNPQIIIYEPLEFECLTCKVKKKGFENMVKFFGVDPDKEKFHNAFNDGSLPKHCTNCRKMKKVAKYTKCHFCESFVENHDYDPIFIVIVNQAYNAQIGNKVRTFKNLQDTLHRMFKEKVPHSYFNLANPSIKKITNLGLVKIKNNLELEFEKISEPETLKKLIDLSYQAPQIKENVDKILAEIKSKTETSIEKSDELKKLFDELKKLFGHIPTSRQFSFAVREKNLWEDYQNKFSANYDKFLDFHMEFIKDDNNLKDSLYGEYFEKCISVKDKISREQLDRHGLYRISDYEDIFGNFKNFEQKTEKNLQQVL